MTKDELAKRIAELERRVRELEAEPRQFVIMQPPPPVFINPGPAWPPAPWQMPFVVTCSGATL